MNYLYHKKKSEKKVRVLLLLDNKNQYLLYNYILSSYDSVKFDITYINYQTAESELGIESDFDVILLYVKLEHIGSIERLNRIKDITQDIPVIIITPDQNINLAITAVQQGAQDYLNESRFFSSVLVRAIFYSIERQRLLKSILNLKYNQANYEPLTGLLNRRAFSDILRIKLHEAKRHKFKIAILFIDLDGFKEINDKFGHDIGDKVLVSIANKITEIIRCTDLFARIGGDEFVISMHNFSSISDVNKLASVILQILNLPLKIEQKNYQLSASIGVSIFPDDAISITELLKSADTAMYFAKSLGKNQIQFFNKNMNKKLNLEEEMVMDLRLALKRGEFEVHLQQQVDFKSKKIIGAEALLRWNHPTKGLMLPGNFIQIAEDSGLIVPIGYYVFSNVLKKIENSSFCNSEKFKVSINVSIKQLTDPKFVPTIKNICNSQRVPKNKILLELTESILATGETVVKHNVYQLKQMGFAISIDDFGTGYSCLNYLNEFVVDYIKIDRSFVSKMLTNKNSLILIKAMIYIAKQFNIKIVAEGVETIEQAEKLLSLECNILQGYYLGKPIVWHEFDSCYIKQQNGSKYI